MKGREGTKEQLISEVPTMRQHVEELEASELRREQAEVALQENHRYTEAIVETLREALVVLDARLKVLSVNPGFCDIFQVTSGETIGKFIFDLGNGQWDIPALRKLLEDILPANTRFDHYEVDHVFPSIGRKVMRLNARRIYQEGRSTEMILLALEDVTARMQAEESLRVSETRYRRLFETAQDGILILDAETGRIEDVNPFLVDMLGYPYEDFLGKRLWEIGAFKDIEASKAAFGELQAKGYVRYEDLPLRTKDGRPMAVEFVSNVYLVNHHKVIQCNIRDITDRTQIAEALQKAHQDLERRVEERTAELQTALSEIKTMKDRLEAENIYFRQEFKTRHQFGHILGQSDGLKYILYRAEQVAPTDTTVLILGETGTGKELIAAAIHHMSSRKDRPLITVNCAALPANLMESELFGREKGAFTGADTRQIGRFEIADGSTLCLDEIGELPLEMQAKLLRAIQHHEFERLGSSHTIKVDVRIVATTNRDLEEEVRKGRFRQDLYYRLNVFPITVPPLRQRKEDIPLLVQAFVERYARKLGKQILSIQKETMRALQDYPWPGNVRELESIIERAVILCPGSTLQLDDRLETLSFPLPPSTRTLEEMERNQISRTLSETRWRINGKDGAAAILGLHPSTLRARMHKLGIMRPETKASD